MGKIAVSRLSVRVVCFRPILTNVNERNLGSALLHLSFGVSAGRVVDAINELSFYF